MSDPVASKSSFLCMYMSNHPDTIVSYVKHYGKINDSTITNAQMSSIDSKGMSLTYQSKSGTKSQVRVEFNPPLSGYGEVKPRLLSMKADAEESLGMTLAPQIKSFRVSKSWTPSIILLLFIGYVTFSPPPATRDLPVYWLPGSLLRDAVGGTWTMKAVWMFVLAAHFLEALYTLLLVRRHRIGFHLGTLYVLATVVIGKPVWSDLRKQVQAARIASIMKGK